MKKITAIWVRGVIFFSLILGATSGLAQEAADNGSAKDAEKMAMEEFQKGIDLFEGGSFVEAADHFRAAMNHKSSWKMYYNIGQSEAAAQRYGLALEAFETYLVAGGDDVPVGKKDEVLTEIERLRLLVGVISLKAPDGAALVIDGYMRGTTPFEGVIRVAAGPHQVQVTRGEEVLYDKRVKLAGGMTTAIDAMPAGDAGPTVAESNPTDTTAAGDENANTEVVSADTQNAGKMPRKLLAGIITGGAGVVFTGVGVAFLIKGAKDAKEAEDWNVATDKTKIDKYNDKTLPMNRAMTIAGLAVGGAAMAAGAVLIVLGLKDKKAGRARLVPSFDGLTVSF